MRRNTLFVSQFLLLPFHQPSTTPRLSPKTQKCWPGWLVAQRVRTRNLKPMASAHPMSLPFVFQPGMRRQARHLPLITMPMPTPELASEKAPALMTKAGPGMWRDTFGEWSSWSHPERSAVVCRGAWWGTKGFVLKELRRASRPVR